MSTVYRFDQRPHYRRLALSQYCLGTRLSREWICVRDDWESWLVTHVLDAQRLQQEARELAHAKDWRAETYDLFWAEVANSVQVLCDCNTGAEDVEEILATICCESA